MEKKPRLGSDPLEWKPMDKVVYVGGYYALPKTKDQEVEAGYQEDKGS